jgi:hypothetical protein
MTTTVLSSKRTYQRLGALFICSVFVGVYIIHDIIDLEVLNFVYTAFAETQTTIRVVVQLFAAFILYYGALRHMIYRTGVERTMLVRDATVLVFSVVLAGFVLSQPGMETSAGASVVNSVLQGSCQYGLFVARYGMMYYWVLRRFSEFRTIDRIAQLVIWFLVTIRDTPILVQYVPGIDQAVDWIMATLYTGALRGVLITVAVGSMILAMRALIGREPGLIEAEVT